MAVIFKTKPSKQLLQLSPDSIKPNPNQPRRTFDVREMSSLTESIRKNGIIQPLAVRRTGNGQYELISGERRLRSAKSLNLATVPCVELDVDECRSHILALLENLQRQDLTFFEEADGINSLIAEWGMTQQEAAEQLGKAQSTIANKLRLLRLTQSQRESIENVQLTERHARALLRIIDDSMRDNALNEIIVKGYNVEETERYIERILNPPESPKRNPLIVRDIRLFVNSINRAIDVMKMSGVNARTEKSETEGYIQYTVIIPK